MSHPTPIGIVCGSGIDLNALLDTQSEIKSFADVPGLPETTVLGHEGQFIRGTCDGIPIILQRGRLHFYEGHAYDTVVSPVHCLHAFGSRTVVFTNAAGGLNPEMMPGDLLAAHSLNLWPCARWSGHPTTLRTSVQLEGCDHVGNYTWIHGPCYETQAEIQALRSTKTDAVGMSTAPEITACQTLGMGTASISCITNNCCSPQKLTHQHVVEIAAKASARICTIIRAALPSLSA